MNRSLQLDYECDKFIAENPHIWERFRMIALKLKVKGIDRYGAKAIWEVLRYELALKSQSSGETWAFPAESLKASRVLNISAKFLPPFIGYVSDSFIFLSGPILKTEITLAWSFGVSPSGICVSACSMSNAW